jgi:mannose-6-phosphate isomerase-like protein (cupin superfamily)
MNQHAVVSKFSHVKPGDTEFRGGGLRDFFLYRDLGIADATGGQVICHLVKANPDLPPEEGTGWHKHLCDFQIVIMTKGWARFMYEDKETLVEAGDVIHQRPGITHYLFDYSKDMEYLEIVSPADFKTVDVEPATEKVPPVTPLEVTDMSSPAELTFVVGRWLRPIVMLLHVVRRLGLGPTSSREQESAALHH